MTTLQERLADLADDAPLGAPPGDLWHRGRRQHRRQVVGTTAIVVAAVVLLAGVAGLDRSRAGVDIEPAGRTTELGLPDRLYEADPHLAGTEDTGPIGPVPVVFPASREDWSGDETSGLVGVSATGEYAFLDLPDTAAYGGFTPGNDLALSADGTKLAYWSTGQPMGAYGGNPEVEPYAGLAVYDTVTGEVWSRPIPTEHGLSPTTMQWAGDTLWFEVWQYTAPDEEEGWGATLAQVVSWDPESGTDELFERTDGTGPLPAMLDRTTEWGDHLVRYTRGRLHFVGADGEEIAAPVQVGPSPQGPLFVSPQGSRVAALRDTDADGESSNKPEPVVVGGLSGTDPPSPVVLDDIPGGEDAPVDELLGWRDESHVVAMSYQAIDEKDRGIVSVDVETGQVERLMPFSQYVNPAILASDALRGEVFDAPPPPNPLAPRFVWGLGLGVVLLAGLLLLAWRRRAVR